MFISSLSARASADASVAPAARTPVGWIVQRTTASAAPWAVRLVTPERLPAWNHGHEAAIGDFFARHAASFGLRPDTDALRVTREHALPGSHHVRLEQTYRGLPVLGADCTVSLGREGDVRTVLGTFVPGVTLDVIPRLSAAAATNAALARLPGPPDGYDVTARLAIRHREHDDRLVYVVRASARHRPIWRELLVDAGDGALLDQTDLALRFTGSGCIYRFNPDTLGLETVPFPRLLGDATTLSGEVVEVHNVDPAAIPNAVSATHEFCFPPTNPDTTNFDQANAYWHVDHMVGDLFHSWGYRGPDTPFHVTVQPNELPGATAGMTTLTADGVCIWYGSILLALPDRTKVLRDGAKEAGPIYHEAAHGVSLDIGLLPGVEAEAAAILEGTADYFAAAALGTPAQGTWTYGAGAQRLDTDPAVYNYGNTALRNSDPHEAGLIWAGALWDMREDPEFGAALDPVALRSLYYMPTHPTFVTAATAVLFADVELRAGADTAAINRALAARGIEFGARNPAVTLYGPSSIASLEAEACGRWLAACLAGLRPYAFEWQKYSCIGGDCAWRVVSTDSVLTTCATADFTLQFTVTNAEGAIARAYQSVAVSHSSGTVGITGPTSLPTRYDQTVCGAWTALTPAENRPYEYVWYRATNDGSPDPWQAIGSAPAVTACGATGFQLRVVLTDALGNVTDGFQQVAVVDTTTPLTVSLTGPSTLGALVPGTFTAVAADGRSERTFRWSKFYVNRPTETVDDSCTGTGLDTCTTETSDDTRFTLQVSVTDGTTTAYAAQLVTIVLVRPLVSIRGAASLHAGAAGTYATSAMGGRPPYRHLWQETSCGGTTRSVGQDTDTLRLTSSLADCECGHRRLMVTVTDADDQTATDTLDVAVSCAAEPLRFAITGGTLGSSASSSVTLGVYNPAPTIARLAIYDLAGRRVVLLHHGALTDGYHGFTWDRAGARSGIYFARLVTPERALSRRIVLVR